MLDSKGFTPNRFDRFVEIGIGIPGSSIESRGLFDAMRWLRQLKDSDGADSTNVDVSKLIYYAPLTNLGYEFEFAKMDVPIAASGGSATVQTQSHDKIVTTKSFTCWSINSELSSTKKKEARMSVGSNIRECGPCQGH